MRIKGWKCIPGIGVLALLLLAAGCSGGGGGTTSTSSSPPPAPPTITWVTVSPSSTHVIINQTQQFMGTVSGTADFSNAVNRFVDDTQRSNSTVGTISSSWLYTAPGPIPSRAGLVAADPFADPTEAALPLFFEVNRGQTDPSVKYLARGSGFTLFLTANGALFSFHLSQQRLSRLNSVDEPMKRMGTNANVLSVSFVGACPASQVVGAEELAAKSNYFVGNDPKNWHTNVPMYARVIYQALYPHIDAVFYGKQGHLEQDFLVAPGARVAAIRLAIGLSRRLTIDSQGGVRVRLEGGEVHLRKPIAYQDRDGRKRTVDIRYVLRANDEIGFHVGEYDTRKPLVIDPALSYSTYLGGQGAESGLAIAVDSSGDTYVTGYTSSVDFPTVGGTQAASGGAEDVFVTKFSSTGTALVYSTYVGGIGNDVGGGLAIDSSGNAYVSGRTESPDFPTTPGAYDRICGTDGNCNSTGDAFVLKLNATGSALLYSTYLGGSMDECGFAVCPITIDSAGNAYITGDTSSPDFPTTVGGFQTKCGTDGTCNSGSDAFVTKLDASGAALVYSTFLGGGHGDRGTGIAVDSSGNAYIAGQTISPDFPVTPGAFDTTCGTDGQCNPDAISTLGKPDGFVVKLNSSGSALLYSTYLGGSFGECAFRGCGVVLDSLGNAYIVGETSSPDFPTTAGAFSTNFVAEVCQGTSCVIGDEAFVAKLNPSGSALVFSTLLGGSQGTRNTAASAAALDSSGNVYVTGGTTCPDFPTASPVQDTLKGSIDAFVSKLNPTGSALIFSTFLGGTSTTEQNADDIAVDSSGNAYVTGSTDATDFPTSSPFQATLEGPLDAFVAKLSGLVLPVANLSPTSLSFGGQLVGTTSSSQVVTLTNDGDATLGVTSVAVTGDFAQTGTCDSSLAPGANCMISVTFAPTASGTLTGTLSITDDAASSPQTVTLTGTGTDFSLGAASGGSTTATVAAGQTATYSMQVVPSGFTGTVALSCAGAPAQAGCSVSPNSLAVNGTTPSQFTVSVTTTARSIAAPWTKPLASQPFGTVPVALAMLLLMLAIAAMLTLLMARRPKLAFIIPAAMALIAVSLAGCGGGGGTSATPPPPTVTGTPAGTYTLTVTGTAGGATRNVALTLIVN
jgi:Abnormal spindle-like microcephaly-assoc'd, ASPM-SPD-2-Hydin/Beta-propeller repeat